MAFGSSKSQKPLRLFLPVVETEFRRTRAEQDGTHTAGYGTIRRNETDFRCPRIGKTRGYCSPSILISEAI